MCIRYVFKIFRILRLSDATISYFKVNKGTGWGGKLFDTFTANPKFSLFETKPPRVKQ